MRVCSLLVAAVGIFFGFTLLFGTSFENVTMVGLVYASVGLASGLLLITAALLSRGRARIAWSLVGAGVLCWGAGEAVWVLQARAGEIPFPFVADFFYVAGYPLIFAGVIALPYLRPGRFERLRLAIDATAGTSSLAVIIWVTYLSDVVSLGSDPVETFLNVVYPSADILLVSALMVLALRRSEQRLDLRIVMLAGAVALTVFADVVFSFQTATEVYVEWGWLDGWWLVGYGLFALTAWRVTRPAVPQETTYRTAKAWQLVAPYSAVAALFAARLVTSTGNDFLLNVATTAVAVLVVLRQNLAVREKRELLGKQRDDLVASVSHELRTPLTGIQGYAQILAESWQELDEADREEMLDTIDSQANHLGHIVSDLIDVARDRLQNVKLNRDDHGAAELVREAIAATGGEGKVRVEIEPETRLWADPDRVRQILANLISNAMRYGRSGILVTVARRGPMVSFSVHDNGDGVPAKFQNDMWRRFERGLHEEDSTVPGSGIGLSVAKDLVIAHGGTIEYRTSEILGGACFAFTIPVPDENRASLVSAGIEESG